MTGAELAELAKRTNENPYFLAYALATGAKTVREAWQRDGNGGAFMAWNNARWDETLARIGVVSRDFRTLYGAEHLDTLAAFLRTQGVC